MCVKQALMGQPEEGLPKRGVLGTLLMLPIGLIVAILLVLYFFAFRGRGYFPGEILLVCVVVFFGLFAIRTLYWSSRRKHWREQFRANQPIRILRQRYARGEITKEEFDRMLRDLNQSG